MTPGARTIPLKAPSPPLSAPNSSGKWSAIALVVGKAPVFAAIRPDGSEAHAIESPSLGFPPAIDDGRASRKA